MRKGGWSCKSFEHASRGSLSVRNSKYDIAAVLAQQQRSVLEFRGRNRPPPHVAVIDDEAGQEVLIVACRLTVLHVYPHQLIAGAKAAVPGAMECRERIAHVACGKRRFAAARRIEGQTE